MCGILSGCRFAELTPGQFGLTKQLVVRVALPHVTLLLLSIAYALIGSFILSNVRHSREDDVDEARLLLLESRRLVSSLLRGDSAKSEQAFASFAAVAEGVFSRHTQPHTILQSLTMNSSASLSPRFSAFSGRSLFFTATALTSIGYGADSPASVAGRAFCILFLFFGIPLYLITLADTAKFCTEGMNRAYMEMVKCNLRIRRAWRTRRQWREQRRASRPLRQDSLSSTVHQVIIAGGDDEVAEFLWTHLEAAHFVEVPFLLVYSILIAYISAASAAVSSLEGWSLGDGFYFIMMSVLTIGFGDVVPSKNEYALVHLAIVLVGLILTTTCCDIVGAYYIDRLHFFGRSLDDDPLSWLKAVQEKRMEAMKREAMRKLFETVTALHHLRFTTMTKLIENAKLDSDSVTGIRLPSAPWPPRNLLASRAMADSVLLSWRPPLQLQEGRRFWYTLTFKTRNPHGIGVRHSSTVVDFINGESYRVTGLSSFTLYQFSLVTTTRFGCSEPVRCQEYTEPCTVPQCVEVDAVSSETVTISWVEPKKNNGKQSYVLQFAQEPAPQFKYWRRFRCGGSCRFTITDLTPDTRYITCVSAEHNFGLAAMSKSIRFTTRQWWEQGLLDEPEERKQEERKNSIRQENHKHPPPPPSISGNHQQRYSVISSLSAFSSLR